MTTTKQEFVGAASTIGAGSLDALGTLASARNCITATLDHTTNDPLDVELFFDITANGTPSGNRQLRVWAIPSVDGTNFANVPSSNTDTTQDEALGNPLCNIPLPAVSNQNVKFAINLRQAYRGGPLPAATKLLIRNDLGVALSAGTVSYREVILTTA